MGHDLLIDNWKLQEVVDLLTDGISGLTTQEIVPNSNPTALQWQVVPFAGIQLSALFSLLIEIVLCDTMSVQRDWLRTWHGRGTPLDALHATSIVKPVDVDASRVEEIQSTAMTELSSLREMRRAVAAMTLHGDDRATDDRIFSGQVIRGTSLYLALSHELGVPYSGHPHRRAALEATAFRRTSPTALSETLAFMETTRSKLFERVGHFGTHRGATLVLPPIVVEVLQEAREPTDLVRIALQLRDKYRKLRSWLGTYQDALESERPTDLMKYRRFFDAVARDIDRTLATSRDGEVQVSVDMKVIKLPINVSIPRLGRYVGMRALFNRQVLQPRGVRTLEKLLRMFGENPEGKVGNAVVHYMTAAPQDAAER